MSLAPLWAVALAAALTISVPRPASPADTVVPPAATLSVTELGARNGQALAAVRICPGARLTAKAETLGAGLAGSDLAMFRDESDRIVTAWARAFACRDVDPAQSRDINGCRRAKILSCTTTWQEIGPDGTALPGLLDFRPDDTTASPGL